MKQASERLGMIVDGLLRLWFDHTKRAGGREGVDLRKGAPLPFLRRPARLSVFPPSPSLYLPCSLPPLPPLSCRVSAPFLSFSTAADSPAFFFF